MSRALLMALLVAAGACSDEPGAHDTRPCDSTSWGGTLGSNDHCERACAMKPSNFGGSGAPQCTLECNGRRFACASFTFDGIDGCCDITSEPGRSVATFCECQ